MDKKNVNDRCREFRGTCTIIFRNVKRKNVSNPDFVALTHWHWDHIFGLSVLQNALTISHAETKKEMQAIVSYEWTDEALDARVKRVRKLHFVRIASKRV